MKKVLALMLAVLMLGSIAVGCKNDDPVPDTDSSTPSSEDTAQGDSELSGTIKFIHHRTDRQEDGTMDKLAAEFNKIHPDVKIEFQAITDYATEIQTMMTSDNYGDVIMTPQSVKQEELADFFVPLGDKSDMSEKYYWVDGFELDGKIYALGHGGTASGILYNKDVWKNAGITDLPESPAEFIDCLKKIADKGEAIPYYTNYKDSWTISQWQSLVVSASGDANYENRLLTEEEDLFYEGSAYDAVYGMLYDIYSDDSLHESDPSTTDWEGSKTAFAEGNIGAMVLGSWAISQFQEAAENIGVDPAVVGYMPFPNKVDGEIYSVSANDYAMSVNKNSKNIEAAKAFLFWFCEESGFAEKEGLISVVKGNPMPEVLSSFDELKVKLIVAEPAPEELTGKFDKIAKDSEVDPWGDAANNFKFKLAEAAFGKKGRDEYNKITADVNKEWNKARDSVLGND